jgi:hypothetical protein
VTSLLVYTQLPLSRHELFIQTDEMLEEIAIAAQWDGVRAQKGRSFKDCARRNSIENGITPWANRSLF